MSSADLTTVLLACLAAQPSLAFIIGPGLVVTVILLGVAVVLMAWRPRTPPHPPPTG